MRGSMRAGVLFASVALATGCVGPSAVRLDMESCTPKRCQDYSFPSWTFPHPDEDASFTSTFEVRRADRCYLVRGVHQQAGQASEYSRELYRVGAAGDLKGASEPDWQQSLAMKIHRQPLPAPEAVAAPAPDADWYDLGPEKSRVSPSGRYGLRIRYLQQYSWPRPRSRAELDVIHTGTGELFWRTSGPAPLHPPLEQFALIGWLDDETLIWPRNQAGSRLTLCWFDPQPAS